MLSKEEMEALQAQVPEEYKYLFDWDTRATDYEDYITDGQPDLDRIKVAHQIVLNQSEEFRKAGEGMGIGDFWKYVGAAMPYNVERYWFYKSST